MGMHRGNKYCVCACK